MINNYLKYVCLCVFLLAGSLSADWSDPITIPNSSSYSNVQVVVDPAGNATAVWSTSTTPRTIEAASKPVGGVWSPSQTISNTSQDLSDPRLVVDPAGNVTAVWIATEVDTILQSSSKPFGGSWSSVESIAQAIESTPAPRLTVDAAGNVTVVFRENIFNRILSVNKPIGGNWSAAENVSDISGSGTILDLTTTAAGTLTTIWFNGTLRSRSKNFGSSWGDIKEIPSSGAIISNPRLTVDQAGNVTAMWRQTSAGIALIRASTKLSDGNWESPTNLTTGGQSEFPNLTVDQAGNVTAIWSRNAVIQSATKPFGGDWGAVSDLSTPGETLRDVNLTVDKYGNVTAVWRRVDGGGRFTFQSAAKPIGGNWSNLVNLVQGADGFFAPSLGIDSSGRITAVWDQAGSVKSSTYQPPVVTTLTPNVGSKNGGNTVEIIGNGFGSTTEVLFGTARATFIVNSPTSITVIAPQGDMSSVDVRVVTSNGIVSPQNADSLYTYIPSTEIPPPSNFVGKIRKNIFLNKTDQVLNATWTPSSSSDVAYYVIYKGNQAVNFVQANGPFIFQEEIKDKNTNYFVKAVGTNGLESVFVPLVLQK